MEIMFLVLAVQRAEFGQCISSPDRVLQLLPAKIPSGQPPTGAGCEQGWVPCPGAWDCWQVTNTLSLSVSQVSLAQRELGWVCQGSRCQQGPGALVWGDDHPSFEPGTETICKHVLMRSSPRKPGTKSSPCILHADSSREPI